MGGRACVQHLHPHLLHMHPLACVCCAHSLLLRPKAAHHVVHTDDRPCSQSCCAHGICMWHTAAQDTWARHGLQAPERQKQHRRKASMANAPSGVMVLGDLLLHVCGLLRPPAARAALRVP